jgi:hypothetical protein
MQYPPDTDYFVYLYVFTCEKCNCPVIDTRSIPKAPQDEIERQAFDFVCTNCNSPNCIWGDRGAVYAKALQVKNGKYFERRTPGTAIPPA